MPKRDDYLNQRKPVSAPRIGLAALRQSHKMTQAKLAEEISAMTGKPYYAGTLSCLENGQRGASAEVLAAIERIFHLSPGMLEVDYEPSHDRRKKKGGGQPELAATGTDG